MRLFLQPTGPLIKSLGFLFAFFISTNIYAQAKVPPAFEIRDDTTWQVLIPDQHVLYLQDSSGNLSKEQVRELFRKGKMKPWRSEYAKALEAGGHYWFYYRLVNVLNRPVETAFDSYANISDFYIFRNDGSEEFHTTGDMVSWHKKKEFFRSNILPFRLDSSESVDVFYHASFITDRFILTGFRTALASPNSYARRELKRAEADYSPRTALSTFYSGIYALATLIYLVFFFLVREKVFVYFAVFLLSLAIITNYSSIYIQRYNPELTRFWMMASVGVFSVFLFFIREFLNTRRYQPKWDKFLIVFSVIFLVVAIYNTVIDRAYETGVSLPLSVGVLFLVTISTFFLLKEEQKKEKKFLLYALLPILIAFPLLVIIIIILYVWNNQNIGVNQSLIASLLEYINIFVDLSFLWLTLSFSRILFRRFTEQRQRIRDQEYEKEQILQQQELERMKLIEQQKLELEKQVAERTAELKKSLEELTSTQHQLIQSEKMASLGEMTAGIAHEIQNPLNFVNNFAEVNAELAEEIDAELNSAGIDPRIKEKLAQLLGDMKANQQKIREHGKRADSIVKNMLQHSRTSSEKKERVDLNAMVDEYVKLSYHGLRARDKSFNSNFDIQLDPTVKEVDLLPQDFGRVILNLVNNAFHAVSEKKKNTQVAYSPTVMVRTERENGSVKLLVQDNGSGIPEKIKEKIFQPFFTTKPSGEGTGLGLSISYDIITKGHGGKIRVESKEGEGSSFIVEIPA